MVATSSAFSAVSYLVVLQSISRIVSFVINPIVVAYLEIEVLSVVNTHFPLLLNVVLVASRQAIITAAYRSKDRRSAMKLGWLAPLLGCLVSAPLLYTWLSWATAEELAIPGYSYTCALVVASALLELLSAPAYICATLDMAFRVQLVVESAATCSSAALLYLLVARHGLGVSAWGYARLLHAAVVLCGYSAAQWRRGSWRRPGMPSRADLAAAAAFQWHTVQNLLLAEAQRIVLKLLASLPDQGLFSVVTNLGSLVVRIVFLPIDTVAAVYFSSLVSQGPSKLPEARRVLSSILKALTILGLFFVAFGPPLSFSLLHILHGIRVSGSFSTGILKLYCVYILLMAVNGITECFVRSAVTLQQQHSINRMLVFFSAFHVAATLASLRVFGYIGLIYADCTIMIIRIVYSCSFISPMFSSSAWLRDAMPNAPLLAALVATSAVLHVLQEDRRMSLLQIGAALLCGAACLVTILLTEKTWWRHLLHMKNSRSTLEEVKED